LRKEIEEAMARKQAEVTNKKKKIVIMKSCGPLFFKRNFKSNFAI